MFGDVPLVKITDYTVTSTLPRANVDLVWETIFSDLQLAKELLPANYPSAGRVRANKWSAAALLARCYLYKRQWAMAEGEATAVINSGLYSLESLEKVFLTASKEAIFQVFPTMIGYSTMEGFMIIPIGSARPPFELSGSLLALFAPDDKRKNAWIRSRAINGRTYYYPFKYTKRPDFSAGFKATEYSTLFRLAEI
ncbi:putative outer membrane starch-binding protein [Chitinophaga ginsengisoli]|uniref:Putative outer membrane starch-binding protein n=1 Tax=Chitinophaga ginsengisoli TaxID=363837 RepID=A0A2P8FNS1_9BACT|nr:putative outer membrane starch-binding protein [Chitinophaga ginsengisoli]